jgi:hypothetical protein
MQRLAQLILAVVVVEDFQAAKVMQLQVDLEL